MEYCCVCKFFLDCRGSNLLDGDDFNPDTTLYHKICPSYEERKELDNPKPVQSTPREKDESIAADFLAWMDTCASDEEQAFAQSLDMDPFDERTVPAEAYFAGRKAALRTKLAELTKIRDKGRALLLVLEDGLKQYDDCDLGQMFTGDWDGDELGIPMSELRAALDEEEK